MDAYEALSHLFETVQRMQDGYLAAVGNMEAAGGWTDSTTYTVAQASTCGDILGLINEEMERCDNE